MVSIGLDKKNKILCLKNMTPKIIKYYRKSNYGRTLEYVHPDCADDKLMIFHLTQKETINPFIRSTLEKLSNNSIQFQEVLAPK
jgi:hypothetical protein